MESSEKISRIIQIHDISRDEFKAMLSDCVKTELRKAENGNKADKLYSVKDAAEILDVSELTVRNHIKRGTIKAKQLGGRRYYISHSELFDSMDEVKSLKYKR